jgi:hypothetical protein
MRERLLITCLFSLLGALLVACASDLPQPTASVIPTYTPLPTSSSTPFPSSTYTLTPSPIPTATVTRTLYPTYTRTISPTPYPLVTPPAGLFYSIGDVLWRVNANNVPQKMWEAPEYSQFMISPDGKRVLDRTNWILHDFSTNQDSYLSLGADYNACFPHWWKANPHLVVVGAEPTEQFGMSPACICFPAIINILDGSFALLSDETTMDGFPDPSPDGEAIAYDIDGVPWIYSWDKGAQEFDIREYGYSPKDYVFISKPAWSPSRDYLAWIISADEDTGEGWGFGSVGIFDLVNKTANILRDYPVEGYDGGRGWLDWSPDEQYLLLSNPAFDKLWLFSSGGELVAEMQGSYYPTWSPDSQWLAYYSNGSIWIYSVQDGQSRNLGMGKGYAPLWSPDGNFLILSDADGDWITQTGVWELKQLDLPAGANIIKWVPGK